MIYSVNKLELKLEIQRKQSWLDLGKISSKTGKSGQYSTVQYSQSSHGLVLERLKISREPTDR